MIGVDRELGIQRERGAVTAGRANATGKRSTFTGNLEMDATVSIPLYHGTSTLFLPSIMEFGLGAVNPIAALRVLDFARAIYPTVREHIAPDRSWANKANSFRKMVEQQSSVLNWQHGDVYLSPSRHTAIRYAVNKRVGSELLSYALDLLQELLNRGVPGLRDELYGQFPAIFELLDVSVAPVVITVREVQPAALLDENGNAPDQALAFVAKVCRDFVDWEEMLGQVNFRLREPSQPGMLTVQLICVTRYDPFTPQYRLYDVSTSTQTEQVGRR
jgi:hypothetical protein